MNGIGSSLSIKQYYVNTNQGASVVRVAFDPHSTTTSTRSSSSSDGSVIISIGTKNLDSNVEVTRAVNSAVYSISSNINTLVSESTQNIINQADDAIRAASVYAPNEEVMGLLM